MKIPFRFLLTCSCYSLFALFFSDIFWYKCKGEELDELENSENYEVVKDGNRQNLTMYNMTHADAGQYMCMAINENGRCCQYFILNTKSKSIPLNI